ncbi:hypothetical protein AQ490_07900 [Wenjunlia vitaminophila]|uniref:Tyrosine specific protein phosphatases domain-containing protein n=1 Tax=Wenjunlia vitaminophila TaxID=76728 RepID=A0A0T6LNF2_WENVI|nr:hypothetical protein AQ490_07900 [Wenjunlia vitaminophila]
MAQTPSLNLVPVGSGALAVTHRPRLKLLPTFRTAGVTHLVTLLSRREGALVMRSAATAAGLEWIWVELADARQPPPRRQREIVAALTRLAKIIRTGATVVIHCSAGIHRTGMFTYALLRTCGLEPDEAMSTLTRLRGATAEGVGEQRLAWAEEWATTARSQGDATGGPASAATAQAGNSPRFTAETNDDQPSAENARTLPWGSLLSRTWTTPDGRRSREHSTHCPPLASL